MRVGVLLGAIGYSIQIVYSSNLALFVLSLALIGLSEVITCMQTYVKHEYTKFGAKRLRGALRIQYAMNVAGTCVGFVGAGVMAFLDGQGLVAQGSFGLFLEVMELAVVLAFLYMKHTVPSSAPDQDFLQMFEMPQKEYRSAHQSASAPAASKLRRRSMLKGVVDLLKDPDVSQSQVTADLVLLSAGPTSEDVDFPDFPEVSRVTSRKADINKLQWINYVVALTFAVQALMIGCVLSTGPILLYSEYSLPLEYIGLLFGFGEFLGTLALIYLIPHKSHLRNFVPGPFNIIVVQATIGTMACMLALHVRTLSMVLVSLIMGLNDFGTSLIAETQGATVSPSLYSRINMLGNVSRRTGNTVTAILGPILFYASCHTPFLLFGILMVLWSMILLLLFETRGVEVMTQVEKQDVLVKKLGKPLAGLRHYSCTSFVTTELNYQEVLRKRNIKILPDASQS